MTASYTTNKAYLIEPGNGDYVNTWDQPVNNNWSILDAALGDFTTVTLTSGTVTLGPNGWGPSATNTYQNLGLKLTGSLSGNSTVVIPAGVGGFWIVENNTSGSFTVTLSTAVVGGINLEIPQGYKASVFSDGTNIHSTNSIGAFQSTGGTITGNVSIVNSTSTMSLTIGSSGASIYGSSSTVGITSGQGTLAFTVASGDLTVSGNLTAYSDVRVKDEIATIKDALSKVINLRGVSYRRVDNGDRNIGVIAQEVREVVPEIVKEVGEESDPTLTVSYGNFAGLFIEAIKEIEARLTAIERKVG
jgi:hypothetical protein